MRRYTIIVEKARDKYSAYCPDLPGCIATGATLEAATERMKEAIGFHIEGLERENLPIPEPCTEVISVEITT